VFDQVFVPHLIEIPAAFLVAVACDVRDKQVTVCDWRQRLQIIGYD
jgi:hypothetical protein